MKTVTFASLLLMTIFGFVPRDAFALGLGTTGNVSAELIEGTLFIAGDREANGIIVSQFEGQILVGGHGDFTLFPWMPIDGFGGHTTVNGENSIFIEAASVSEIVIVAGGGGDVIQLRGMLEADVFVDGGEGEDLVAMLRASVNDIHNAVSGNLSVNTGQDDDRVVLIDVDVAGDTDISTGNGKDDVGLAENLFEGSVAIDTGVHSDRLTFLDENLVAGNFAAAMGQADDIVDVGGLLTIAGLALFDGGQGTDAIDASNIDADPANLSVVNFESP